MKNKLFGDESETSSSEEDPTDPQGEGNVDHTNQMAFDLLPQSK